MAESNDEGRDDDEEGYDEGENIRVEVETTTVEEGQLKFEVHESSPE